MFSNALISMGVTLEEFVKAVKPDILVFSGTKNGLMFYEAILVFNKLLAENCEYLRKQTCQLVSKIRFMLAQFLPYIRNNLWYTNAQNANKMAGYFKG